MNWNFTTTNVNVRLPINEQDGNALFALLQQQHAVDHIPRIALTDAVQVEDELRRMTMQFETREGASWLVTGTYDDQLFARITVKKINWMMRAAQLQWELAPDCDNELMTRLMSEAMNEVLPFLMAELGLHRLEMRLRKGSDKHTELLKKLCFTYEGCLPSQLEFDGEDIALDVYSILTSDLKS
ncbi:MAG: GNAT family N-acetyltransferase [Oleibacter sp.]|nr:GNAT family N-acetyltransferase [Thalassolituus sp.]